MGRGLWYMTRAHCALAFWLSTSYQHAHILAFSFIIVTTTAPFIRTIHNTSPLVLSSDPGVFYTYFYNHAHRLGLEKLLYLELSRSSNGYFKPRLDPGGGFRSETTVT